MAFFESDGMRACKIPFTLQFYSEINRKAQKNESSNGLPQKG